MFLLLRFDFDLDPGMQPPSIPQRTTAMDSWAEVPGQFIKVRILHKQTLKHQKPSISTIQAEVWVPVHRLRRSLGRAAMVTVPLERLEMSSMRKKLQPLQHELCCLG